MPVPNSATDKLIPSHLSFPAAPVELGTVVVELGAVVVFVVEVASVVEVVPGKHWEYHSL